MLAQIQAYLRLAASRDRMTEQIGPFRATISPDNDNPYLNYAIPDDGATPSELEVQMLMAFYQAHQRKPRLEYVAALAPEVEAVLFTQGFAVEGRLPLMVYEMDNVSEVSAPEGIELIVPQSDDDIAGSITAQNEAYGDDRPITAQNIQKRRDFMAAGGLLIYSRDQASGEPVGSGVCDVPRNGTTELASIGVRETYRRRGIAGAMTAWLTRRALAEDVSTVFLMAMGEAEARIYARIGFQPVGEVIHISRG